MIAMIRNNKYTLYDHDLIRTALLIIIICFLSGCIFRGSDKASSQTPLQTPYQEAPNILIITVDNLGYGDLPIYNQNSPVKTPNIDQAGKPGGSSDQFLHSSTNLLGFPGCIVNRPHSATQWTGLPAARHRR